MCEFGFQLLDRAQRGATQPHPRTQPSTLSHTTSTVTIPAVAVEGTETDGEESEFETDVDEHYCCCYLYLQIKLLTDSLYIYLFSSRKTTSNVQHSMTKCKHLENRFIRIERAVQVPSPTSNKKVNDYLQGK